MNEMSTGDRPKSRDVFGVERREQLSRLVNERGRIRTSELARLLNVTEPTIRKDINDLESQGFLVRTHGGAVARGSMAEVDVATRETQFLAEKRLIARACHALIREGDSVFLDGGTTQYELARLLANSETPLSGPRRGIKILTNSFKVGEICASMIAEPPIILGGRYRPTGGCFVGPITLSTLQNFRVDIAFIGVTGVTATGFCGADVAEAQIKTEAINRAERAIVPMDHSKVGRADFLTICPLSAIDTVVTNRVDSELADWLETSSVELIVSDHKEG